MRNLVYALLIVSGFVRASATTWYVRSDGGTRYDAKLYAAGQCDGKSDAAYPGAGVNQHCGFSEYRFLWDFGPGTYGLYNNWAIVGGDTVIVDNARPFRVGFEQATTAEPYCSGGSGPYACTNPTVPANTGATYEDSRPKLRRMFHRDGPARFDEDVNYRRRPRRRQRFEPRWSTVR